MGLPCAGFGGNIQRFESFFCLQQEKAVRRDILAFIKIKGLTYEAFADWFEKARHPRSPHHGLLDSLNKTLEDCEAHRHKMDGAGLAKSKVKQGLAALKKRMVDLERVKMKKLKRILQAFEGEIASVRKQLP
jgi:hypothetical protein